MESEGSRISAVHAADAMPALGLTCVTSVLRVRMLNAPYTIGFMHELVHANMNSACCTFWSTICADCMSVQYLCNKAKTKAADGRTLGERTAAASPTTAPGSGPVQSRFEHIQT